VVKASRTFPAFLVFLNHDTSVFIIFPLPSSLIITQRHHQLSESSSSSSLPIFAASNRYSLLLSHLISSSTSTRLIIMASQQLASDPDTAANAGKAQNHLEHDQEREQALTKHYLYYEGKAKKVHAAMLEIWGGADFKEVATKYKQTPEGMAVAFACFGKMAFDIAEEKGVVRFPAFLFALVTDRISTPTPHIAQCRS
jgi:hypothetical protein